MKSAESGHIAFYMIYIRYIYICIKVSACVCVYVCVYISVSFPNKNRLSLSAIIKNNIICSFSADFNPSLRN